MANSRTRDSSLARLGSVLIILLASGLPAMGCSSSPTAPTGGNTGNTGGSGGSGDVSGRLGVVVNEGALDGRAWRIRIQGPDFSDPQAAVSGAPIFSTVSSGSLGAIVMSKPGVSSQLITFQVSDTTQVGSYSASIEAVAGADNRLLNAGSVSVSVRTAGS